MPIEISLFGQKSAFADLNYWGYKGLGNKSPGKGYGGVPH